MDHHKEESEKLELLKEDWESMDSMAEPPQISQHEILEQLDLFKLNRKKSFRKELTLFILTAIFVLGLFVTIILKSTQLILYIQVAAALLGPVIYVFLTKREGKVWQ